MIHHENSRPNDYNENRLHPPPTGAPPNATLSPHHERYLAERGVGPGSIESGAFWTARRPSEVPGAFSERQRRRTPALIAAHVSPDGRTVSYQMRPDNPFRDGKGRPVKWVSPKAEKAPVVLNVPQSVAQEVRHGTGPLWLCEGITRGHALAERGIAAASYAGCYTWQKDGEPLRCFEHINLAGRLVYDVPDADARTNRNVHDAQKRRVAYLESRGAHVLTVSVPEVGGDPNTGLDDYIAAGGNLDALTKSAHPFVPVDVNRERLSRDERLRAFLESKRHQVENLPTRKARECSAATVARYLVEDAAASHGKFGEAVRGVRVRPSIRQIAAGVRVSVRTALKALDHLEGVGFLERDAGPRRREQAASYLLLDPWGGGSAFGKQVEERRTAGKETQEKGGEGESPLYKRESFPGVYQTRSPNLRGSKVVLVWERKDGRRVVVDSQFFFRYGKKRELIVRRILEAGPTTEAELHGRFGSAASRLRDFRRRCLAPMLADGVLVEDGGTLDLSPDWPDALQRVRDRTDEDEDNRRQDERYTKNSRDFRARLAGERRGTIPAPEPTPDLAGPERVAEIRAAREKDAHAARLQEQRQKVGVTAETFLDDALEGVSGFGWRELRALWMTRGGRTEDLRRAIKSPYRFQRDGDGPLYVVRTDLVDDARKVVGREPAPVSVLRGAKTVELWRSHPLVCECVECVSFMPAYARPWKGD